MAPVIPARPRSSWLDPLALGVAAAVVSSIGSWIPSKWNDEAATQTAATRTLGQLWQMMQNIDAVHGTYYAIMHFWIIAFGTSNFALRVPSMLAVGVACAGVVVLGKRLGNRRIAICAALVFMILPRVTWMGIEARSYAMTAAVAVWLTILLLTALERRRTGWFVLYAVFAAFGVALNLYIALLIVAHGVVFLLGLRRTPQPRRLIIAWGVSAFVAAVLASPIVRLAVSQTSQLPFGPINLTGTANSALIEEYFSGATPTFGRGVPVPPTSLWALTAIILACVGWVLILAPVILRRIRPVTPKSAVIPLVPLVFAWMIVPLVMILGYSALATPIYTARYFSFTTPAVALLIGTSIAALGRRWQRVVALAILAALAVPIFVSQRGPTAKNDTDWQQAATIIQEYAKPGQDIYYGPVKAGSNVSTSKISDAYPAVLDSLHDITLRETGAQNGRIWDSQWPLAHASAEVRSTPLLWVVLEHYGLPSPKTTAQEKYFEANGLHLARAWRGPSTDVLLFER